MAVLSRAVVSPARTVLRPVEPFAGSGALLIAHRTALPQPDQLCGAFWAALATHALAPHSGAVDVAGAARRAGSAIWPQGVEGSVPPGEGGRHDGWEGARLAQRPDEAGTSAAGVIQAIELGSGGSLRAIPATGRLTPAALDELLSYAARSTRGIAVLANVDVARWWGSHPSDAQLERFLVTGEAADGPPAEWGVGHFVALWGRIRGQGGTLVAIADTFVSLGNRGLHLQPLQRVAAALQRDAEGEGGLLLVVPTDEAGAASAAVRLAGLREEAWSNGAPPPPQVVATPPEHPRTTPSAGRQP